MAKVVGSNPTLPTTLDLSVRQIIADALNNVATSSTMAEYDLCFGKPQRTYETFIKLIGFVFPFDSRYLDIESYTDG